MIGQTRLVHLKRASGLETKCGATDATIVTNWVRGASFPEIYVPAEVVGSADVVCRKCQEEALVDDTGSDDEVVPEGDETREAGPAAEETDLGLVEVSDRRLIKEIARRLGDEAALAEEEGEQTEDHRG
jgi:hypothetical protein